MENIKIEHQEHRNRFERKRIDDQKQKIEDQFEKIMELLYQNEKNE